MMKILIVANVAKEHIIKFHIPTIKMLKENDWEVHVACSGKDKVPYCDKQWEMKYKRNPFSCKTIVGIFQLRKILKSEEFDIIHCHTATGGIVARLACINLRDKTKVIYTAHGFHFFKGAPLINWMLFYPVEKCLSYFTDVLITINQEDYENAKNHHFHAKKILKIPGVGVKLDRYRINDKFLRRKYREELKIPENSFVLIYVAEIIKNKNQKMILDALVEVQKLVPDTYLLLVGPDHTDGELANYVKDTNIPNVIFTGWRNDVPKLLNCTDCYVASSIREGLGINLIEAMSCGLPVIASNNRGHRDIINDNINGRLIKLGDYKNMANAIINVYNNQKLKDNFIKNANIAINNYKEEIVLEELRKVYKIGI
ncbi:glycosyltransferase family 4 protein [Thomasclavelia sp.]